VLTWFLFPAAFCFPLPFAWPPAHNILSRRRLSADDGALWDVWDVHPDDIVGRFAYDRRTGARADTRASSEHTTRPLDPQLAAGWLCFQHGDQRRRFAPIPPRWDELPETVLRIMLDAATIVPAEPGAAPRPSVAK
jgi:hypothetical protein